MAWFRMVTFFCALAYISAARAAEDGSGAETSIDEVTVDEGGSGASGSVLWTTIVEFWGKKPKRNVTQLIIPGGMNADIKCPLKGGTNPSEDTVYVLSAAYGQNFDAAVPVENAACINTKVTEDVTEICVNKKECTVAARDPSMIPMCRNRSLRVRFICIDTDKRGAVISHLID